jgi:cysteine desulfurase
VLVSLIYVNNEIGTILDVKKVAHVLRKWKKEHNSETYPLLHIDASQAPAWLELHVNSLGVDFITLDGQKVYGPKGIGCLYVKNRELLEPILHGGGQEKGLRPGTPPTPLIVGFARALEILEEERDTYVKTIKSIRDWFFKYIEKEIPDVQINGPRDEGRIAGNIHLSFKHVEGEQVVIEMDAKGVAISTGSACLAEETGGSHVVKALDKDSEAEGGSIRLSLSRHNTKKELKETAKKLVETVKWLRETH